MYVKHMKFVTLTKHYFSSDCLSNSRRRSGQGEFIYALCADEPQVFTSVSSDPGLLRGLIVKNDDLSHW